MLSDIFSIVGAYAIVSDKLEVERGIFMLLYIYEHNVLIYAMIILMGIGLIAKVMLAIAYSQLIKASKEMGASNNRLMKQIRLRFDTCYKIKLGVHNVDSFVDKYVYSYKFCGITLYTLENLSGQLTIINLLITLFGSVLAFYAKCGQDVILSTLTVGASTILLLIAFDLVASLSAKQRLLRIHMKDYLENNLKAKLENEYFLPQEMVAYRNSYFEKTKSEEVKEEKKSAEKKAAVADHETNKEVKGRVAKAAKEAKETKEVEKSIEKSVEKSAKQLEDDKIIEEILKEYLV